MSKRKKFINWLWVGLIGVYVNLFACLLTDYSLWFFFGFIIGLALTIGLMLALKKT
jgi:hypothetical protein